MLSLEEIDKAILDLEAHDTTYATCEKLAWLYIVKDHTKQMSKATVNVTGSEFLSICNDKPVNLVLSVIDEHMEIVKALYPKEYNALIAKIKEV